MKTACAFVGSDEYLKKKRKKENQVNHETVTVVINVHNIVICCFLYTYIDHEINLKTLEFIINSIGKIKSVFLLSSMCMFPESNREKS